MHSLVFCCKHAQLGFLLQTCTAWFPAADCKHVQFPAAKGTGHHASSHIITSYVLKRNWKQANKKESRALFFVCAGRFGLKMPFLFNASLPDIFIESGCIFLMEIIPHRHFLQIRMNFLAGNHPCETFPVNQDQFPRRKSSLPDFSRESGSIPPTEIIPARLFLQIRMNFLAGNHPSQTFPANQDAFPRWKSSLSDISCESG